MGILKKMFSKNKSALDVEMEKLDLSISYSKDMIDQNEINLQITKKRIINSKNLLNGKKKKRN
jgi:hypothetical protein